MPTCYQKHCVQGKDKDAEIDDVNCFSTDYGANILFMPLPMDGTEEKHGWECDLGDNDEYIVKENNAEDHEYDIDTQNGIEIDRTQLSILDKYNRFSFQDNNDNDNDNEWQWISLFQ